MSDGTHIEWTDATWNIITGCSVLSPGCTNCYAMRLAGTRLLHERSRAGLTKPSKAGPVWNGKVRFNDQWLDQPLKWKRPRKIFVCAHGDLFHESVPDEWIDKVWAVMALAPHHVFQVLTKRAERMRYYLADAAQPLRVSAIVNAWPDSAIGSGNEFAADLRLMQGESLPNVWLGVSVEDQKRADERIPDLLAAPAAKRWLSMEPMLGPVDLGHLQENLPINAWLTWLDGLDWVVVGGESGAGSRPMHPDWARSVRDQCEATGVAFLFKQWGEWEVSIDRERDDPDWRADYTNDYVDRGRSAWLNLAGGTGFHGERFHVMRRVGKKSAGRLLDGVQHDGFPS